MPYRHPAPLAVGLLFVLMGLVVGTGGVWLLALGGAWYYLPGGLVLVLTGLLLLQRNPAALWVHAALLVATLIWSVWEGGLSWRSLAVRGDVLFLLGLLMCTPWFARGLFMATQPAARHGLGLALAAFASVGAASWFYEGRLTTAPTLAQAPLQTEPEHALPGVMHAALSAPLPQADRCNARLQITAAGGHTVAFSPTTGQPCADQAPAGADRQALTDDDVPLMATQVPERRDRWGLALFDHLACRIAVQQQRFEGRFAPAASRPIVLTAASPSYRSVARHAQQQPQAVAAQEPVLTALVTDGLTPSLRSPLGLPCQPLHAVDRLFDSNPAASATPLT